MFLFGSLFFTVTFGEHEQSINATNIIFIS
jgi:hypothetical protein